MGRWGKPLAMGLTVLFTLFGLWVIYVMSTTPTLFVAPGSDREIYVAAGQRWASGEWIFYPDQLRGPYLLAVGHVLYPPVAYPAFYAASLLPALFWWLVPLSVTAAGILWHRPAYWSWPIIAACLAFPWSLMLAWAGNPTIWLAAFVSLGTIRSGWAIAVLAKPTLAPFALVGIRRRTWWWALAGFLAVSAAFGQMWLDWIDALRNAYGPRVGPLYSVGDVPWLLAPIVAWKASTRRVNAHISAFGHGRGMDSDGVLPARPQTPSV